MTVAALVLPAATTAAGSTAPATTTRLSDGKAENRWAYPTDTAVIHSGPSASSRPVGRLHALTEDNYPEVYLLLQRRQADAGSDWVQLRIPGRPNGRTGWVPREALGDFHLVTVTLEINRRSRQIVVRKKGKVKARFPVGIGKRGTPTPAGYFWIREKFAVRPAGGAYGPRAMGTAAYSPGLTDWPGGGVIGLHGTNEPQLIPGAPSHGCVRLRNPDMLKLYGMVPVGTPLRIV